MEHPIPILIINTRLNSSACRSRNTTTYTRACKLSHIQCFLLFLAWWAYFLFLSYAYLLSAVQSIWMSTNNHKRIYIYIYIDMFVYVVYNYRKKYRLNRVIHKNMWNVGREPLHIYADIHILHTNIHKYIWVWKYVQKNCINKFCRY